MKPLLELQNVSIAFSQNNSAEESTIAVSGSSFTIERGKITAIVGESGSGKSVTALSVLKLLPPGSKTKGKILFSEDGVHQADLLSMEPGDIRKIRGNKISMIFQEPMTSLNPVFTCGNQVMEAIRQHRKISKAEAKEKTIGLFRQVELPDPTEMIKRFPHQLSGGQKQRVMIAMAMSCDPLLLIADEPTTALDVRVQKNIIGLIKKLQAKNNMGVILITHDLGLVSDIADQVIVMYKGEIVEAGSRDQVLAHPAHPYTKALISCRPANNPKGSPLPVIENILSNTPDTHNNSRYPVSAPGFVLLKVENLTVEYRKKKPGLFSPAEMYKAVDDVSFEIKENETVGLVGESGCGKTTLGRAILQLIKPSSGKIMLDGKELSSLPAHELRVVRKDLQVVFQDPYGSLNPRLSIGEAILEPLRVHDQLGNKKNHREQVEEMLSKVKLNPGHFYRYPHQFSGGQRQRICIARALILKPSFLIFDESVSALDVSVQAQVLNLINELKSTMNFTSLFISHDLSVVHHICDRIMVMKKGRIIETGSADQVYHDPQNDYTRELLAAIPGKEL